MRVLARSVRVAAALVLPLAGAVASCATPRLAAAAATPVEPTESADDSPSGLAQSLGDVDDTPPDRHDPFDIRRLYNGLALSLGFFQARDPESDRAQRGWELRFGRQLELRRFHLFLLGTSATSFRAFDSKSFSLVLFQPDITGGVFVGPLEVGAGAALTLFSVDDFDTHWSAQSLSPRVHADVGFRFGGVRLAAQIFGEEYWRWFGDDRRLRGFAFTVSFDRPPAL